jgi:hypothetical protein
LRRGYRPFAIDRQQAQEFLGVVYGLAAIVGRAQLSPVEVRHNGPGCAEGVRFVLGQVVGEAGHRGVHLGASQLLVVRVFARCHLDERRAAQEHL